MENRRKIIFFCVFMSLCVVQSIGGPQNYGYSGPYPNSYSYPFPSQQTSYYGSNPLPPSTGTCGSLWSYQSDDYGGGQNGLIKILNPHWQNSHIRISLTVAAQLHQQNTGSLVLAKSIYSTSDDIQQGRPLLYRVNFPIQNPLPQIHEIYYNNQLLCSAPKVASSFVTTLSLEHTYNTGLMYPPYKPAPWTEPTLPYYGAPDTHNPTPTTRRTTTRIPVVYYGVSTTRHPENIYRPITHRTTTKGPVTNNDNAFECGVSDFIASAAQSLVINGENVKKSQYPWLAVLYHNPQSDVSGIFCGGSLVSRKLVVTAAHCIRDKHSELATKAEDVTIYLGKLNMESLDHEPGFVLSSVVKFIVHPHWSHLTANFDADIAVAVLEKSFRFTRNIRPICLPTSTETFEDIVGKKVVIAGWGKTESNALSTSVPKWAEITVIDTDSCLDSNRVFRTITSGRTFCAGEDSSVLSRISGSGPCSGDSGGGLTINIDGIWYLRGVISSTVKSRDTQSCDPKYFSVFTDVAQFRDWLQKLIITYR